MDNVRKVHYCTKFFVILDCMLTSSISYMCIFKITLFLDSYNLRCSLKTTTDNIFVVVFWDITAYSLVDGCQRFGVSFYFHVQEVPSETFFTSSESTRWYISEFHNIHHHWAEVQCQYWHSYCFVFVIYLHSEKCQTIHYMQSYWVGIHR
jgi:hypothetical protein